MPSNVTNKGSEYLIARAPQRCEQCHKLTPAVGLMLPPGHESLVIGTDTEDEGQVAEEWEIAEAGAVLFCIGYLSDALQNRLRLLSPSYFVDYGDSAQECYWMNHCCFCRAPQSDFDVYCEPEGAFMPISADAARRIELLEVPEPFAVQAAGYALAPEFLQYARRVPLRY